MWHVVGVLVNEVLCEEEVEVRTMSDSVMTVVLVFLKMMCSIEWNKFKREKQFML